MWHAQFLEYHLSSGLAVVPVTIIHRCFMYEGFILCQEKEWLYINNVINGVSLCYKSITPFDIVLVLFCT